MLLLKSVLTSAWLGLYFVLRNSVSPTETLLLKIFGLLPEVESSSCVVTVCYERAP